MSGGTPPALLTILQYSEKDWKAIGAGPSKPSGTVVAEGGGRVFVARVAGLQSLPGGQ